MRFAQAFVVLCLILCAFKLTSQTPWQQQFERDQNGLHNELTAHIATDETRIATLEAFVRRIDESKFSERMAVIELQQKTITELLWFIVGGIILMIGKDFVAWVLRSTKPVPEGGHHRRHDDPRPGSDDD